VKERRWPSLQFPRVPGHEVIGVVGAVSTGVSQWKPASAWACAGVAVIAVIAMRVIPRL